MTAGISLFGSVNHFPIKFYHQLCEIWNSRKGGNSVIFSALTTMSTTAYPVTTSSKLTCHFTCVLNALSKVRTNATRANSLLLHGKFHKQTYRWGTIGFPIVQLLFDHRLVPSCLLLVVVALVWTRKHGFIEITITGVIYSELPSHVSGSHNLHVICWFSGCIYQMQTLQPRAIKTARGYHKLLNVGKTHSTFDRFRSNTATQPALIKQSPWAVDLMCVWHQVATVKRLIIYGPDKLQWTAQCIANNYIISAQKSQLVSKIKRHPLNSDSSPRRMSIRQAENFAYLICRR